MTCKECIHFDVCDALESNGISKIYPSQCGCYKPKSRFIELPFVAMIEQTIENGQFCQKKKEQYFNGRYCVVYVDKDKWGCPLIDIVGTKYYDREEAEKALAERNKK